MSILNTITKIIPLLKNKEKKLNITLTLTQNSWCYLEEITSSKYYFESDGLLIKQKEGLVQKGSWKLLTTGKSILFELGEKSIIGEICFVDSKFLIISNNDNISVLVNYELMKTKLFEQYLKNSYGININYFAIKSPLEFTIEDINNIVYTLTKNHVNEPEGMKGQIVSLNKRSVKIDHFISKKSGVKYYLLNSVITRKSINQKIVSQSGKVYNLEKFITHINDPIGKGDNILDENNLPVTGTISFRNQTISVKNGVIQFVK
jgi:hypothetical protein